MTIPPRQSATFIRVSPDLVRNVTWSEGELFA